MAFHDFTEEWYGWRLRGRFLVSPDGDRITSERLRGILFREDLRKRYSKKPVSSKPATLDGLRERVNALRPPASSIGGKASP